MFDLKTQLREHYESVAPAIDIDRLVTELEAAGRTPTLMGVFRNRAVVATAAAAIVVVAVGSLAIFGGVFPETAAVVDEPAPTTMAPTPETPIPPPNAADPVDPTQSGAADPLAFTSGPVAGMVSATTSDGRIVLASVDWEWRLNIATCADLACAGFSSVTIDLSDSTYEPEGNGGTFPGGSLGLAVLPDGSPVVTFTENVDLVDRHFEGPDETGTVIKEDYQLAVGALLVLTCADANCSDHTVTEIDRAGPGTSPDEQGIAIGSSGFPILAYFVPRAEMVLIGPEPAQPPDPPGDLIVFECANRTCSSGVAHPIEVDAHWTVGGVGVTVDLTGRVLVATGMGLVICADGTCGAPIADLVGDTVLVGQAGIPIVVTESGYDIDTMLSVKACDDRDCTSFNEGTFALASPDGFTAAVDSTGMAAIAWIENNQVFLARCEATSCGDPVITATGIRAIATPTINIGSGDIPLLIVNDGIDLKPVLCADRFCTPQAGEQELQVLTVGGPGWETVTVAEAGVKTWPLELILDPSGLPAVAYETGTAGAVGPDGEPISTMFLYRCDVPSCGSGRAITTEGRLSLGTPAIPADDLPVVAHAGWDMGGTTLDRCSDADCSGSEHNLIGGTSETWFDPDMSFGMDGNPVIVFADALGPAAPVKLGRCADASCASTAITVIGETKGAWSGPQVAVDSKDRPVVLYRDWNLLTLARCVDASCSAIDSTVLDHRMYGDAALELLLVDDQPVVAYTDGAALVKVQVCRDLLCVNRIETTLDTTFDGWVQGLMIGPAGYPLVYYRADGTYRLAVCRDGDCSTFESFALGGLPANPEGTYPVVSVITDNNGLPIFAYLDSYVSDSTGPAGSLRLARCTDPACLSP